MKKAICIFDMPDSCAECPFRGALEEFMVEPGLYKKISRCRFAPEEIEDPWRDIGWQCANREAWCPLKPLPEKFAWDYPWRGEYEAGWNDCIDAITKEKENE